MKTAHVVPASQFLRVPASPRPRVIQFLCLLSVLALSTAAWAQPGPTMVSTAPVVARGRVEADQTFVGNIDPVRKSIVGSAVGGRVVEFLVKEGDAVAAHQPLARLLTNALEIQRDAALADRELREQELKELEAGARPEERTQAEAKMKAAKSLMDYSKSKLERTQRLATRRAASEDQLQDDTSAAERNLQAYYDAKAAYELVMAGPRQEKIAQAKARVAVAQEEVNRLEDQLMKHTIFSPFEGYVVAEHTEVGQWISSGDPVAEIVEIVEVDVTVMVLENYVPHLRIGSAAKVQVEALPGREFLGKVTRIVPRADTRSRSFPVKVRLRNEPLPDGVPLLKPGMFARVTLPVAEGARILMVPKDALVLGGPTPVVFALEPDAKNPGQSIVRKVPIEIGMADEGQVEVRGELAAGQQVVIEGNERLRPGQSVLILESRDPATDNPEPADKASRPTKASRPAKASRPTKTSKAAARVGGKARLAGALAERDPPLGKPALGKPVREKPVRGKQGPDQDQTP